MNWLEVLIMTAKDLSAAIGKRMAWTPPGTKVHIGVLVMDAREAWGRTDYLVTPEIGEGSQWVSSDRIKNMDFGNI